MPTKPKLNLVNFEAGDTVYFIHNNIIHESHVWELTVVSTFFILNSSITSDKAKWNPSITVRTNVKVKLNNSGEHIILPMNKVFSSKQKVFDYLNSL